MGEGENASDDGKKAKTIDPPPFVEKFKRNESESLGRLRRCQNILRLLCHHAAKFNLSPIKRKIKHDIH